MKSYFTGKTIWVTGASSGIGKELVLQLSEQGCKLLISSRTENTLYQIAEICEENGSDCEVLSIDLNHCPSIETIQKELFKRELEIDILINCAGVSQRSKAENTSVELDRMFMEVNFFAPLILTKAVLPQMLARNKGQIVMISSILGDFGLPLHSSYAAAKHALNAFSESLKEELVDTNVKINVISPGFINTDVALNAINALGEKMNKNSPAQQNGMPTKKFVTKALLAIAKDKPFKYIGGKELLSVPLHHYFPKLFYYLLRKLSKGE